MRRRIFLKSFLPFMCAYLISTVGGTRQSGKDLDILALATAAQGHIVGSVTTEAVIFRGIPFSQAPVGKHRWKKPRDPVPFNEDYWNATYFRPGCSQVCHNKHQEYTCPTSTSEDCLYLNIWVPRSYFVTSSLRKDIVGKDYLAVADKYTKSDDNSMAVMVFLHGGNFRNGAGSATIYDGRFLAKTRNVIIVTTNYRLGPIGFLVQGEGKDAAVGNYGIWDQIKALNWVKRNIKHFGGNQNKITLFGQSAGAQSVGIMMTSPHGKGLFHQAILESDPLALPFRNLEDSRKFGNKLAKHLGCDPGDMACLRNVDANTIAGIGDKTRPKFSLFTNFLYLFQPWGPVIDQDLLVENPMQAFQTGNFHRMPVIMGDNENDAFLFVNGALHDKVSDFIYHLIIPTVLKHDAIAVLKEYPSKCKDDSPGGCDEKMTLSRLATDWIFKCPTRKALFSSGLRSWFFIFDAALPFKSVWSTQVCLEKVCHGAELPYVFDTIPLSGYHFTDGERELSRKVQFYWTNFAKYGNPNGGQHSQAGANQIGAEQWVRFLNFQDRTYNVMNFTDHGNSMITDPLQEKCDFWDKLDVYGKS